MNKSCEHCHTVVGGVHSSLFLLIKFYLYSLFPQPNVLAAYSCSSAWKSDVPFSNRPGPALSTTALSDEPPRIPWPRSGSGTARKWHCPAAIAGTILECRTPFLSTREDSMQIYPAPPRDRNAPSRKSNCPPTPESCRVPTDSGISWPISQLHPTIDTEIIGIV